MRMVILSYSIAHVHTTAWQRQHNKITLVHGTVSCNQLGHKETLQICHARECPVTYKSPVSTVSRFAVGTVSGNVNWKLTRWLFLWFHRYILSKRDHTCYSTQQAAVSDLRTVRTLEQRADNTNVVYVHAIVVLVLPFEMQCHKITFVHGTSVSGRVRR